jgi:hypothetical protein
MREESHELGAMISLRLGDVIQDLYLDGRGRDY